MLEFLERVMCRCDQLPPILPSIIESDATVSVLSRIHLAVGSHTIIVDTLHYKVLSVQVVRMIRVRGLRLFLVVGARTARTQQYFL